MAYEVVIYGFLGGALRAIAGMMNYGARSFGDAFFRLLVLGFIGVIGAFAYLGYAPVHSEYLLVFPAYAGADLLKSFYEIAAKANLRV